MEKPKPTPAAIRITNGLVKVAHVVQAHSNDPKSCFDELVARIKNGTVFDDPLDSIGCLFTILGSLLHRDPDPDNPVPDNAFFAFANGDEPCDDDCDCIRKLAAVMGVDQDPEVITFSTTAKSDELARGGLIDILIPLILPKLEALLIELIKKWLEQSVNPKPPIHISGSAAPE